jgi:hypothetical protein
MNSPSRHLSVATDSQGHIRYHAIYGGQPLCSPQRTFDEALTILRPFLPDHANTVDLWDGDLSEFRTITLCGGCDRE